METYGDGGDKSTEEEEGWELHVDGWKGGCSVVSSEKWLVQLWGTIQLWRMDELGVEGGVLEKCWDCWCADWLLVRGSYMSLNKIDGRIFIREQCAKRQGESSKQAKRIEMRAEFMWASRELSPHNWVLHAPSSWPPVPTLTRTNNLLGLLGVLEVVGV